MPRWEPVHPEFIVALRALDAFGMPYAELWRALRPVAARLGRPRPSYWLVRRIAIEERRRKLERMAIANAIFIDLCRGVFPRALK